MHQDEGRDREAEQELGPIGARQAAQAAALIEGPDGQREMNRDGAVKDGRADGIAPDKQEDRAAFGQRLVGGEPQGVIEKMRRHVAEQDQPAGQPYPPQVRRVLHGCPLLKARKAGCLLAPSMIIDLAMIAWEHERVTLRHLANPRKVEASDYPAELRDIVSRSDGLAALAEIETWPGYEPTPLHELAGFARRLGIGRLWYKDESGRFGLGSFKALGGAYAVYRYLAQSVHAARGRRASAAALMAGQDRDLAQKLTVATATDGNHGRSVAWGASLFGARAIIYIHATVSEERRAAIEAFGAEVRRVAGNYDDSVHRCAAEAAWTCRAR